MNYSIPQFSQLTGFEKTAILMNVLGKEKAFEIMKELKDADVRKLLKVMGNFKKAPIGLINAVLHEYLYKLSEKEEIIFDENLSKPELISEGLGEQRAKQIFGTLKAMNLIERKNLTVLDSVDAKSLAEFLSEEHPQTIAIVLAHMDITKQISLLKTLPDTLRPEVVLRMANLDYIPPEKVDELDEILKTELSASGDSKSSKLGGILPVADLINSLDKKTMNSLMTKIEDKDPILAEQIRQHMFTFTDMVKIEDKGIQLILREVPNDRLMLALKSSPDELKEKIFSSMSERAAEIMREDLGAMGPQKVSDVEAAQREIVNIVKKLQEEGKIVIGLGGEDSEIIP